MLCFVQDVVEHTPGCKGVHEPHLHTRGARSYCKYGALGTFRHAESFVDEVFFEYHFDFDGIDFGWHIRKPGARRRFRYDTYSNATVDDALGLMRQLRERGVRSHFWV